MRWAAKPIMALAILGMPLDKVPVEIVREILKGGAAVCAAAGIPVAGGHSIDSPEPIYGLAVIGTCRPDQVRRNAGARAGDALVLTKAIGVGVYSAALKKGELAGDGYAEMIASTTQLNRIGGELGDEPAVHAVTDVTGFGLLGHALEMARGSGVTLSLRLARRAVPAPGGGLRPAAASSPARSHRNWASYGEAVTLAPGIAEWQRHLLTDPQTSGGLLIACAPDAAEVVQRRAVAAGFASARMVGRWRRGRRACGWRGDAGRRAYRRPTTPPCPRATAA